MPDIFWTEAQRDYKGPDELKLFADFLPHIGEFVILFAHLERHVTWSIESFLGASRWDGNELEGMIQSFSARIKFLDICARPKLRDDPEREKLIIEINRINAFRNKILHNSVCGIARTQDTFYLAIKILDKKNGKESTFELHLERIKELISDVLKATNDLRSWTTRLCPDAEKRVP